MEAHAREVQQKREEMADLRCASEMCEVCEMCEICEMCEMANLRCACNMCYEYMWLLVYLWMLTCVMCGCKKGCVGMYVTGD